MVYFLQYWIVNPMLNHLKRTMTYLGFEPGTFGVAVSIPNHYTGIGKISALGLHWCQENASFRDPGIGSTRLDVSWLLSFAAILNRVLEQFPELFVFFLTS
jgi:hypothetical protein